MKRTIELAAYVSANLNEEDIEYLVKEDIIPKKPPTKEELHDKKNTLLEEMESLGLTEDEFKELSGGLSLEEYRDKKAV